MDAAKLRKAITRCPFVPVQLALHAGDPVAVRHPENVLISDAWVAIARDPDPPIVFEAEMVASITFLKNGRSRK